MPGDRLLKRTALLSVDIRCLSLQEGGHRFFCFLQQQASGGSGNRAGLPEQERVPPGFTRLREE